MISLVWLVPEAQVVKRASYIYVGNTCTTYNSTINAKLFESPTSYHSWF